MAVLVAIRAQTYSPEDLVHRMSNRRSIPYVEAAAANCKGSEPSGIDFEASGE
jgi:hypothetical protein